MKQEKGQSKRQFVENPMEEGVYSNYEIRAKKPEVQQPEKDPKEQRFMIVAIIVATISLIAIIASINAMCTVEDKLIETRAVTKGEQLSAVAVVATTTAEKEKTETKVATESMETTVSTVVTEATVTTANTTVTTVETTLPETVVTGKPVTEPVIEETTKPQTAVLSAYGPSDTYYYDISYEDKVLMAKMVYRESGTEPFEGKVAIAAVILNRFFYGEGMGFDRESIKSVLLQKNQFADISKVTMEDLEKIPDCMEAVEAACKGWDPTRVKFKNGAFFFYAPALVTGYQKEIRENLNVLEIYNVNFHENFEPKN